MTLPQLKAENELLKEQLKREREANDTKDKQISNLQSQVNSLKQKVGKDVYK
jgi:hypothetical protein